MSAVEVSEEQVLYFRARRGHLAGAGAQSPLDAARALIGAQAQQLGPGLLALSQRTRGRPTVAALKELVLGSVPELVRTWGQRETLHIFDPNDWHLVAAAREAWAPAGRRGPMPSDATLAKALQRLERRGTATRDDVLDIAPSKYLQALQDFNPKYIPKREAAIRFAAGRLFWRLAMRGDACVADKAGSTQSYAARRAWFPDLPWPQTDTMDAAVALTRRYLAVNGPATTKDVAYHFGARQREAKSWIDELSRAGELTAIRCGERKGLVLLECDVPTLREVPPRAQAQWPLRLLPQWDTYLMAHADKSWTTPVQSERKVVWRSSAVVVAGIFVRGRVVAEWQRAVKSDRLEVTVLPLSGWRKTHLAATKREVKTIASHLELGSSCVVVA